MQMKERKLGTRRAGRRGGGEEEAVRELLSFGANTLCLLESALWMISKIYSERRGRARARRRKRGGLGRSRRGQSAAALGSLTRSQRLTSTPDRRWQCTRGISAPLGRLEPERRLAGSRALRRERRQGSRRRHCARPDLALGVSTAHARLGTRREMPSCRRRRTCTCGRRDEEGEGRRAGRRRRLRVSRGPHCRSLDAERGKRAKKEGRRRTAGCGCP